MRRAAALVAAVALILVAAVPAAAADLKFPQSLDKPPPFHALTGRQAGAIAGRVPKIRAEVRKYPDATRTVYLKGPGQWQVSWFTKRGGERKEIAQVTIDDRSGAVLEAWTGFRVAWTMARGYDGAFGRKVNAPYVWIPLLVAFVVPFVDPRRPFRLLHLDVLVLAAFSVSLAFFTDGRIETSVPLVYPPLAYLLLRMLWIGLRRRPAHRRPRLVVPATWLVVGLIFLMGFRIGLNVTDSNVIDVGYAGVIGADRIVDGKPLYGDYPSNNEHGDTYGPVNYLLYVPFEQALPWSGGWDALPAAHGAAIAFDLLALLVVFLLGRRIGGRETGVVAAYAWAAYPFTLYALNTNANDAAVPMLVGLTLLLAGRPALRGAAAALAALTKFAPAALAPLLATYGLEGRPLRERVKRVAMFAAAFAAVAALVLLLLAGDLSTFYDRTIGFQADRAAPFSVWGLYDLQTWRHIVQAGAVLLAVGLALVPRRADLAGLAALSAAILIAVQLSLNYWFYLYLVWFFPFVMLALLAPRSSARPSTS